MRTRRHHNNKGYRQVKRGKTWEQVKRIADRLGLPYYSEPHKIVEMDPDEAEQYWKERNGRAILRK